MAGDVMAGQIDFTKEQGMMLDIAQRFCTERWTVEQVRAQMLAESSYDQELWGEIVELGWPAIAIPEAYGGIGQSLAEVVTIVEPMGRRLQASPLVSSQLVAQALLAGGDEQQKQRWLPKLAEGSVATVALVESDGSWLLSACTTTAEANQGGLSLSGNKSFVTDLPQADLVLVSAQRDGQPVLALLGSEEIERAGCARQTVIDETRRSYRLELDGLVVPTEQVLDGERAMRALGALERAAWLLISAEACGGTAAALELIVEYLNSRRQFGQLIGGYQALKHPTVDVLIGLERARSHLYHAATRWAEPEAESALRMAKIEACEAFVFAGDRAVQFHGGVGFTYECDAQLYLRRALWCQSQFGDALHHRARLADLLL